MALWPDEVETKEAEEFMNEFADWLNRSFPHGYHFPDFMRFLYTKLDASRNMRLGDKSNFEDEDSVHMAIDEAMTRTSVFHVLFLLLVIF